MTAENAKLRIVVVDDNKVLAETLAAILQGFGFSATCFTNPLEALHSVRSDPPDLLISDVLMPELSGTDLAMLIKELCPSCKILLCSGQADTENLLQAARTRGHNFHLISKPIHPTDLLREIVSLRLGIAA
jgi:CheY-like chemotaxis protein